MKLAGGRCKINGIHIVNASIQVPPNMHNGALSAEYATVEGTPADDQRPEGSVVHTHGKCLAYPGNWSETTRYRLKILLESMEEDLLKQHFEVSMEGDDARLELGEDEKPEQI